MSAGRAARTRSGCGRQGDQQIQDGQDFTITITEDSFTFTRNLPPSPPRPPSTTSTLRTSLPADTLPDDDVVLRYKGLEDVERFFRTLNSELDAGPSATTSPIGSAPMFLRMLSTTSAGT